MYNLLEECLQPTNEMVKNVIEIQNSYINTYHPDFMGGANSLFNVFDPNSYAGDNSHRLDAAMKKRLSRSGKYNEDEDADVVEKHYKEGVINLS